VGDGRRSWLGGLLSLGKRYLLHAAAFNLGLIMRKLFGVGTPRSLQGRPAALCAAFARLLNALLRHLARLLTRLAVVASPRPPRLAVAPIAATSRPRLAAA